MSAADSQAAAWPASCRECRAYTEDTEGRDVPAGYGECHRHAPMIRLHVGGATTFWPLVAPECLCHEGAAR